MKALPRDARLRFLVVGGVSTALHYAVLVLAVEALGWDAVGATAVGFIAGAALNYTLNRRLSFASQRRHREALPRFLTMVGLGTLLNSALLQATLLAGWHYLAGQVLATAVVLVYNYLVLRYWVFPVTADDATPT